MTAVLLFVLLFIHPFHVSVTEVVFIEKTKSLQVSQRIFLDDLELALQLYSSSTDYQLSTPLDSLAISYLRENTSVSVNNRFATMLGAEEEQDVLWVYSELDSVDVGSTINYKSRLLTRTFDDQENLVHFKFLDQKISYRLSPDKRSVNCVLQ